MLEGADGKWLRQSWVVGVGGGFSNEELVACPIPVIPLQTFKNAITNTIWRQDTNTNRRQDTNRFKQGSWTQFLAIVDSPIIAADVVVHPE